MLARLRKWAKLRATGSAAATGIARSSSASASKSSPRAAAARPLRQRADPLDPLEVRHALVAAQCFAQQLAEQPHVVAERLVRIAGSSSYTAPAPYPSNRSTMKPADHQSHAGRSRSFGGGRRRRPPDRLEHPQRDLRQGDRARRRVRGAQLRDRPHQRRVLAHFAQGVGADGAGLRRLVEDLMQIGCSPAHEHDALLRDSRARRQRPGRFLFDHQPADARARARRVGRGRAAAHGRGGGRSTTGARRAASCARSRAGDRVVCGLEGIRVTPEFRERDRARFRLHVERNLVGAPRRSQRRPHRDADARDPGGRPPDRLRRRPGRRPHRRRRPTSPS